jgi:hypothetical protein
MALGPIACALMHVLFPFVRLDLDDRDSCKGNDLGSEERQPLPMALRL